MDATDIACISLEPVPAARILVKTHRLELEQKDKVSAFLRTRLGLTVRYAPVYDKQLRIPLAIPGQEGQAHATEEPTSGDPSKAHEALRH